MDKDVVTYFSKPDLKWKEEQLVVRDLILDFEFEESIKWGRPTYSMDGKNLIGLSGFKNYFTIWFFQGVFLTDQNKVLVNAQESKTKGLRQWRFDSIVDIDADLIKAYVAEAIANHKSGKEIKISRSVSKSFVLARELKMRFDNDKILQESFNKLTPGRQKVYSNYIDEAKRDATKLSRIEKIVPLVLNGLGLHDKYKNC